MRLPPAACLPFPTFPSLPHKATRFPQRVALFFPATMFSKEREPTGIARVAQPPTCSSEQVDNRLRLLLAQRHCRALEHRDQLRDTTRSRLRRVDAAVRGAVGRGPGGSVRGNRRLGRRRLGSPGLAFEDGALVRSDMLCAHLDALSLEMGLKLGGFG